MIPGVHTGLVEANWRVAFVWGRWADGLLKSGYSFNVFSTVILWPNEALRLRLGVPMYIC